MPKYRTTYTAERERPPPWPEPFDEFLALRDRYRAEVRVDLFADRGARRLVARNFGRVLAEFATLDEAAAWLPARGRA